MHGSSVAKHLQTGFSIGYWMAVTGLYDNSRAHQMSQFQVNESARRQTILQIKILQGFNS